MKYSDVKLDGEVFIRVMREPEDEVHMTVLSPEDARGLIKALEWAIEAAESNDEY